MTRSRFALSRRAALRGLGASIALPFLDVMRSSSARAQTAPGAGTPKRLMFFYVPCGIDMATFLPTTTGRDFVLSPMLEPLANVRDHVTVISGLKNTAAKDLGDGGGDHARGTGAFLTAVHPLKSETQLQNGPSADQVAAAALRGQTRLPSLEMGCESGSGVGACDIGYSCAYSHNISWASPTVPMPKEVNPRAVFDRLFAGADAGLTAEQVAQRRRRRSSILDFVREDTRALSGRLGTGDKAKLDEYLTGIRDLEQRIENVQPNTCSFPERPQGADADVEVYVKQMLDLAALAMQCDLTRVTSFMLGNGGSNRSYGFLGHPGGHHEYSHHQGDPDKLQALADIGRWEVSMVAHFLEKLQAVQESDGTTALDNTLLFFSSELEDGNSHSHDEMPVLLVGKGGGVIDAGQHVRIEGAELGDVFLTMLKTVGVEQASFGEYGTRVLDEILQ
jgi:hypothetical protein